MLLLWLLLLAVYNARRGACAPPALVAVLRRLLWALPLRTSSTELLLPLLLLLPKLDSQPSLLAVSSTLDDPLLAWDRLLLQPMQPLLQMLPEQLCPSISLS